MNLIGIFYIQTKWTQQYHIPGEKCSIIKDPLRQMYH